MDGATRGPTERKEAFYAASRHEIGSLGVAMCQHGGMFCDKPFLVLVAAGLAACWGTFVSVR